MDIPAKLSPEGTTSLSEIAKQFFTARETTDARGKFATKLLNKALDEMGPGAELTIPMAKRGEVAAILANTLDEAVGAMEKKFGATPTLYNTPALDEISERGNKNDEEDPDIKKDIETRLGFLASELRQRIDELI